MKQQNGPRHPFGRQPATLVCLLFVMGALSPGFAHNHWEPEPEETKALRESYRELCAPMWSLTPNMSREDTAWCIALELEKGRKIPSAFGYGLRAEYLAEYPQGRYAAIARQTLKQMESRLAREAAQAEPPATTPSEAPAAPPPAPQQQEYVIERPAPSVARADEHGCWETASQCVALDHKWTKNLGLHLHFTNTCGARIYMQYCYEHCRYGFKDGICDTKGLADQERWTVEIPADFHPTGPTWVQWLGSLDTFKDDECTAHSPGWVHNANPYSSGPGVTPPPCEAGE